MDLVMVETREENICIQRQLVAEGERFFFYKFRIKSKLVFFFLRKCRPCHRVCLDGSDESGRRKLHRVGQRETAEIYRLGRWKPSAVFLGKLRHVFVTTKLNQLQQYFSYLIFIATTIGTTMLVLPH